MFVFFNYFSHIPWEDTPDLVPENHVKISGWKMNVLVRRLMFRGYVSFRKVFFNWGNVCRFQLNQFLWERKPDHVPSINFSGICWIFCGFVEKKLPDCPGWMLSWHPMPSPRMWGKETFIFWDMKSYLKIGQLHPSQDRFFFLGGGSPM